MSEMISKCGINCSECNAYKATVENSDELRKKTAEEWSAQFGAKIEPSTVNCMGCQESNVEKVFSHCKECQIRSCANGKGYSTCADCSEFGCKLVAGIWEHDPKIKENLEKLRA